MEEELLEENRLRLQAKIDLHQQQTLYCEVIAMRRARLQEEQRTFETFYKNEVLQRNAAQQQRENDFGQKKQRLAADCHEWNAQNQTRAEDLEQERLKKLELEHAMQELQVYEQERLAQIQDELQRQKLYAEFYELDMAEKARNAANDRQQEKDFANNTQQREAQRIH